MQTSQKKDLVFATLATFLGIWLSVVSFQYSYESSVLLRVLSLTVVAMGGGYLLLLLLKKSNHSASTDSQKSNVWSAVIVFSLVIGCALLIPVLGFFVSFFLFILVTEMLIAKQFKTLYIMYAVGLSLFIYVVFFGLLGVSIPDSYLPFDHYLMVF